MKTTPVALALACATLMAACAADEARNENVRDRRPAPVEARSGELNYFIVTRQDFRKCAYPLCGGVYVAEVNQAATSCFAGSGAPVEEADCYAAEIDLSMLGLDQKVLDDLANHAENGSVILRGNLVPLSAQYPAIAKLEVEAAWKGQSLATPTGHFSHVADAGIACVTFPCFSLNEAVLNTEQSHALSGLDLAGSGASEAQIDAAQAQLSTGGIIVAGDHVTTTGPAGEGLTLAASEFYMPVKSTAGEPCGNAVCGAGTYCCNASCSMCVPTGNACIQMVCEPEPSCAHSECAPGAALQDGCSPCAATVCATDPYCCTNEWDALCVEEAETLCGGTCTTPPLPAGCAHGECTTGGMLEASCSPCATAVCGADPFCCTSGWDALCVDQAAQICGSVCAEPPTCKHDECAVGPSLDPQCSSCAASVCQADSYCCDVSWDSLCTQRAAKLCGC